MEEIKKQLEELGFEQMPPIYLTPHIYRKYYPSIVCLFNIYDNCIIIRKEGSTNGVDLKQNASIEWITQFDKLMTK